MDALPGLDFTPAVGDHAFTAKQRSLLALANGLGRTHFAPRAAQWDEEASFPFANYEDLRRAGLLKLCVPESHGGLGADYATYMMVAAEIGRFCGATALTYNMHICSTMWTGVLADGIPMNETQRAEHSQRRELHFRRVVQDGAVYAQPFSEGSAAAAGRAPFGTTARKVDGGWLVNGRKIFASLSGAADYYGVLCTEDKGDEKPDARDTLYLAVPATSAGFSISGDWNPLGMRGTVSRNLTFKDVFVSEDEQLMPRGIYYKGAQTWPAMSLAPSITVYWAAYKRMRSSLDGWGRASSTARRKMLRICSSWMRICATATCLVGYMRRFTGGSPGTSPRRYCTVKS